MGRRQAVRHRLLEPAFVGSNKKKFDTEISSLTKEERYVKTLTDRISKKIISKNNVVDMKLPSEMYDFNKTLEKDLKKKLKNSNLKLSR